MTKKLIDTVLFALTFVGLAFLLTFWWNYGLYELFGLSKASVSQGVAAAGIVVALIVVNSWLRDLMEGDDG